MTHLGERPGYGQGALPFSAIPPPCGSALWDPDLSGRKSWRYSPECVERLSEKGYEQHTERGFGRRREAEMGRKVPFRCSVSLHRRLLRPFSDSFKAKFTGVLIYPIAPVLSEGALKR